MLHIWQVVWAPGIAKALGEQPPDIPIGTCSHFQANFLEIHVRIKTRKAGGRIHATFPAPRLSNSVWQQTLSDGCAQCPYAIKCSVLVLEQAVV